MIAAPASPSFSLEQARAVAGAVTGRPVPGCARLRDAASPGPDRPAPPPGLVLPEGVWSAADVGPGSGAAAGADAPPVPLDPRLRPTGLTLGAIVRDVRADVEALPLSPDQRRTLARIARCRTRLMGGVVEACPGCGFHQAVRASCGDRTCPGCGALVQARWVEATHARTLPVAHLHVVVTLPPLLRPLAARAPRVVHGLLLRAAVAGVKDLVAEQVGPGVLPGLTAVLHTWNRWLGVHPHAHLIVTAGGLAPDGAWRDAPAAESLLPGDRLGAAVAAAVAAGLDDADRRAEGGLACPSALGEAAAWDDLLERTARVRWHVYAKRTLPGAADAFGYLAAYTSRSALSNHRLRAYDPARRVVELVTKKGELYTLDAVELVRRVLAHVPPPRFHRLRHAGLYAPRAAAKRAAAREQLAVRAADDPADGAPPARPEAEDAPAPSAVALYERLTGVDLSRCPRCGEALHTAPLRPLQDPERVAAELLARVRAARPDEGPP